MFSIIKHTAQRPCENRDPCPSDTRELVFIAPTWFQAGFFFLLSLGLWIPPLSPHLVARMSRQPESNSVSRSANTRLPGPSRHSTFGTLKISMLLPQWGVGFKKTYEMKLKNATQRASYASSKFNSDYGNCFVRIIQGRGGTRGRLSSPVINDGATFPEEIVKKSISPTTDLLF